MEPSSDDRVSRRKYEREVRAREEAERLLEQKSRELFLANQKLSAHSEELEVTVATRTEELREALKAAEAASEMRSRFVATMSHEIRTPLGGLLGMIDLVLGDETDPEKREYLEYAKTSGQALRRIVNDVLDFSKMEAGAFQFKDEPVDLKALITGVVAMARANLGYERDRLTVEVSDTVPALFLGDGTRVRQVISNLVSNAIRYSVDGEIQVRASATGLGDETRIRVEVEDFGVGIPLEQQENLFKDFTQIQNELTSAAQGTGLGLAISKRIVEGAGGEIGVDSVPDEGSVFWFELPVEVIQPADVRTHYPVTDHPVEASDTTAKTVLLVEDNHINQMLLFNFLDRMGLGVELANNGQIAVDKFKPGAFDLILMDVAMPVMDGLQAIRRLRADWSDSQLPPIALLTAHVMETIEEEGKAVGVDRVLSKPITFEDLKTAVFEILDRSKAFSSAKTDTDRQTPKVLDLMTSDAAQSLSQTMPARDIPILINGFVADARDLLTKMHQAQAAGSSGSLGQAAHSLKGAAGLLGFAEISAFAGHLEDAAEDVDAELLEEMATAIDGELSKIEACL